MKYELQLYQFFRFSSVSRIPMSVMYSGCCDGGDIVNATSQPSLCEPSTVATTRHMVTIQYVLFSDLPKHIKARAYLNNMRSIVFGDRSSRAKCQQCTAHTGSEASEARSA
jgi:hypothetical protein